MRTDLSELFAGLESAGYYWEPLSPDRLVRARQSCENYSPLHRYFGLGLSVTKEDLIADGLNEKIADSFCSEVRFEFAVSRSEEFGFLLSDHWPPSANYRGEYIHLGPESFYLANEIVKYGEQFVGKSVMDLGCGGGVLTFACKKAQFAWGCDLSKRAIAAANALIPLKEPETKIEFEVMDLLSEGAKTWKHPTCEEFDFALFNPPLAVPSGESLQPHRDGGKLGIGLPLAFLDFAIAQKAQQIWFLVGDPIVGGKSVLDAELAKRNPMKVFEKQVLFSHFNQTLARQDKYADQGIQKIELCLVKLMRA